MLFSLLAIVWLGLAPALQASGQPAAVTAASVRETLAAARTEIEAYRANGGKPGAPDHPALKWHAELWAVRAKAPGSEAATFATAEAIQLLLRAEFVDAALAKIDAVDLNDPAWVRLSAYVYFDVAERKDYARAVETLTKVASGTRVPTIKSAALLSLGRVQRRLRDVPAAVKSLEAARDAAPDSPPGIEADGLLYDINNLSIGLVAPAFSATTTDGHSINLDTLRGHPAVFVFWGST